MDSEKPSDYLLVFHKDKNQKMLYKFKIPVALTCAGLYIVILIYAILSFTIVIQRMINNYELLYQNVAHKFNDIVNGIYPLAILLSLIVLISIGITMILVKLLFNLLVSNVQFGHQVVDYTKIKNADFNTMIKKVTLANSEATKENKGICVMIVYTAILIITTIFLKSFVLPNNVQNILASYCSISSYYMVILSFINLIMSKGFLDVKKI